MQGTEQHAQLVEVKCPHSVRDGTVTEAAQSKKDFFLGKWWNIDRITGNIVAHCCVTRLDLGH